MVKLKMSDEVLQGLLTGKGPRYIRPSDKDRNKAKLVWDNMQVVYDTQYKQASVKFFNGKVCVATCSSDFNVREGDCINYNFPEMEGIIEGEMGVTIS